MNAARKALPAMGAVILLLVAAPAAASAQPVIESESASDVTPTDATLTATINTGDLETGYEFQIYTNETYDFTQRECPLELPDELACQVILTGEPLPAGLVEPEPQHIPAGSGIQLVSVDLAKEGAKLQPATTYYFRVLAKSSVLASSTSGRLVTGPSQTFTTTTLAPVVTALEPSHGPTSGETTVRIVGDLLENVRSVQFGTIPAESFHEECNGECEIEPYTEVTAVSPPHAAGTVNVTVTNRKGEASAVNVGDEFTYTEVFEGPRQVPCVQQYRSAQPRRRDQLCGRQLYRPPFTFALTLF